MKKIFLTAAITLGLAFGAAAQTDGFFSSYNNDSDRTAGGQTTPGLPNGGETGDQTPVGSGLLILTALGAGYAVAKKRD